MSIKETVHSVFEKVAASQGRVLAPLTDELDLSECGLDSFSFAMIVVSLDDALGFDPFRSSDTVKFPATYGDFVQLYDRKME